MTRRRLRSSAVPLGAVAVLAGALLAGCGRDDADAYCVTEVRDQWGHSQGFEVVDDARCDGSDGSTWIAYSSSYPRAFEPGDRIAVGDVGTRVRASDPGARAAHGFSRSGAFPARGGFGGRAGGGGG